MTPNAREDFDLERSKWRHDTLRLALGCFTGMLLVGILIGGATSCVTQWDRNATDRVRTVCAGDLKSDAARAVACAMAVKNAGHS